MHPPGTPSDPLHTWRPASDRSNVLIVAPPSADYLEPLSSLRHANPPCEVVSMDSINDSLRLVRRGSIAVVVLEGHPSEPGSLEFIIEALGKEKPPLFLILSRKPAAVPSPHSRIRTASARMDRTLLKNLVLAAAGQFEDGSSSSAVSAPELLEAAVGFPDDVWLRVTNEREESGDLCIRDGRIIYCEAERLSGAQAAARILSWNDCRFECRELPAFLNTNMDHPLDSLSALAAGNPARYSNASPGASSAYMLEAGIEEPLEFLSLDSCADGLSGLAEPGRTADIDEPLMMPEFTATVDFPESLAMKDSSAPPAGDFLEEPLEMMFEFSGEPAFPPAVEILQEEQAKETGFILATEPLFDAVAVIAASQPEIEICMPETERPYFDAALLRGLFDQARQSASLRRMGAPSSLRIRSAGGTLAIELIPETGRLVAAYLKGDEFGLREETELHRLIDSLPAVSKAVPG
ncbi:MAG: DUF4388 domain-containing protein [Bryobacterales bacterium]|nr:DUF4388 domain-containing protein [Bryobacterales bacterium]